MSEHNLSAQEFAALLRLLMVSDPYPGTETDNRLVVDFLNEEAESRNYNNWVDAYHQLTE